MPLRTVSNFWSTLPAATLAKFEAQYTQAISDVLTAGQSHAVSGRSFTLAHLEQLENTLAEIQAAINTQNGTRIRRTRANFGGYTL
jgi:hypothetical protein